MYEKRIPADYTEMDLLEAKRFDKKVKENFMPAIVSTVKQIIEDYGILEGVWMSVVARLFLQLSYANIPN
ncbi:MAG: hypothetical protein LWW94_00775 [Candidatus Desulfofervidaceae bacterium]|nr:hypothetical protein [Candidatus Desulfofervidaceae bacterium]